MLSLFLTFREIYELSVVIYGHHFNNRQQPIIAYTSANKVRQQDVDNSKLIGIGKSKTTGHFTGSMAFLPGKNNPLHMITTATHASR